MATPSYKGNDALSFLIQVTALTLFWLLYKMFLIKL